MAKKLTSGGVATFGDLRSIVGFELRDDLGDRSTEWRVLCKGEGESGSDLASPLLTLLATLGVAGETLLGVSDKPDLFKCSKCQILSIRPKSHYLKHTMQRI